MKTPKTCPRCGNTFLHRGNLNNHLRKQKECPPKYLPVDREQIISNYEKYELEFNVNEIKHKIEIKHKFEPETPTELESRPKLKFKLKKTSILNESLNGPIVEQLDNLSTQLYEPNDENNTNEAILAKLMEIMGTLSKNISPNTNVTGNNSNVMGGNSKQLNQHFNITVNTFGNEDLSHITHKDWNNIIKQNINAIPELTKKIYIDEQKNHNVYITSPKDGYCKVYTPDGWKYKGTKNILNEIIENGADRIYDYMESDPNKAKKNYEKMSRVIDKLEDENSFIVKQNISDIKELFINHQDKILINE
jgi:hypothetical protein